MSDISVRTKVVQGDDGLWRPAKEGEEYHGIALPPSLLIEVPPETRERFAEVSRKYAEFKDKLMRDLCNDIFFKWARLQAMQTLMAAERAAKFDETFMTQPQPDVVVDRRPG